MAKHPKVLRWYDRTPLDLVCPEPTMAQQQFQAECDINNIVRRGRVPPLDPSMLQFGDFTGLPDYQSAANSLLAAQHSFDRLPSDLRARFFNDPARFVEFALDPKNLDELRRLGLARPVQAPPEATGGSSPPDPAGTPQ